MAPSLIEDSWTGEDVSIASIERELARLRDESRGAHYKPDFPNRDDENFLKTTKAAFVNGAPSISYEEVDTSHIKPRPRVYTSS